MDLFTYLMAKNGNNSSVHGDLFSYLLGKGQSQTQTISGVTIYIPNAKKLVSFMMTKESTQETTSGKNLYDKDNLTYIDKCNINSTGVLGTENNFAVIYTYIQKGTYSISNLDLPAQQWVISDIATLPQKGSQANSRLVINNVQEVNYTLEEDGYILIRVPLATYTVEEFIEKLQIELGEEATDWEEYTGGQPSPNPDYPQEVKTVKGSVDVNVSNGETTNTYTINLGNNELVGIGDYKDELKVDKSGHVFINKKTRKIELAIADMNNSDNYPGWKGQIQMKIDYPDVSGRALNIYTDYFCNIGTSGITINTSGNNSILYLSKAIFNLTETEWKEQYSNLVFILYYGLQTPELIDLQTTVDLKLFEGVNNVSNSEDGYMTIEYK